MKVEDGLGGFLMRPVQTQGDGVFDECWMRIAENGENGIVAIVSSGSLGRFRISWEHRRVLEGAENIILPIEIVTRFHLREIYLEIETNGTAVVLVQKFVGDNVDTAGISVTREESVPNA
jgi:hypothetical protein